MSLRPEPPRSARLLYAVRIRIPFGLRRRLRRALVLTVGALPSRAVETLRRRQDRALSEGRSARGLQAALRLCSFRPIPPGTESFAPPGAPDLRFASIDSNDVRRAYWLGLDRGDAWTAAEFELWSRLCGQATSVLEIGANVGFFTVLGGRATAGRYVALEPHPTTAAALRTNLELNGLTGVKVIEAAAVGSGEITTVTLVTPAQDPDPTPTGAQIELVPDAMRQRGRESLQVDAVDVRGLVEGVDLLKVDVEGAELQLLQAVDGHLVATTPVIMVEVLPTADELRDHLAALAAKTGYQGWAMTRAGLHAVDVHNLSPTSLTDYGTWDLLLTPKGWIPGTEQAAGDR